MSAQLDYLFYFMLRNLLNTNHTFFDYLLLYMKYEVGRQFLISAHIDYEDSGYYSVQKKKQILMFRLIDEKVKKASIHEIYSSFEFNESRKSN